MTDQHEPDERPVDSAGPPPERAGTGNEPAAGTPAPDRGRPADDEFTTRLTPPTTAPAVDDEPTVERPKPAPRTPADDGGTTRRIVPPAVMPGPASDTPGTGDPEHVGPPIAEPFPAASASNDAVVGDDAAEVDRAGPDRAGPDRAGDDVAGDDVVSPDVVTTGDGVRVVPDGGAPRVPGKDWPLKKFVSAGVLIWVLLALFGFTLVVQLRSNNSDEGLASARQDDLVRILSDLEARDTRLQAEIAALETSQRQLTSGVAGRNAALAEAEKRADELGLLAGTLPGQGRGLDIKIDGVRASAVLNTVQELRGAGGEVMQLNGATGGAVRIVASTYFVDGEGGGIVADGKLLTGPYQLLVIGMPQTMQTALEIPGGVVASVKSNGGSVTMEQRNSVEVTALRAATSLQYARPVS